MLSRMLGAHGRVVQKSIGAAHVFLHTRAPWAEPNGTVFWFTEQEVFPFLNFFIPIIYKSCILLSFFFLFTLSYFLYLHCPPSIISSYTKLQ